MRVLFFIIQVLNTGLVCEYAQMSHFLPKKRCPLVSIVKSEFPGYNGDNGILTTPKRMRQRVLGAWGIQTGPFASC